LPRIVTRTRVALLIHHKEHRKPTNTGRLAVECLENAECWIRGQVDGGVDCFTPDPHTLPLLLFPSDDARSLLEYCGSEKPVTLIVPDGNWRQASKFRRRVLGLSELPTVLLPPGAATQYRLRHEPRLGGLATIEAIARALGILESKAVEAALLRVFSSMVERTLWSRGAIDTADIDRGVPNGAMRHDPLSGTAATAGAPLPERRDRC
jgi:DTW domain-containing protein YfiP